MDLYYRNTTDETHPSKPIAIPGCTEHCPLDIFNFLTHKVIPVDHKTACEIVAEGSQCEYTIEKQPLMVLQSCTTLSIIVPSIIPWMCVWQEMNGCRVGKLLCRMLCPFYFRCAWKGCMPKWCDMILMIHQYQQIWTRLDLSLWALMVILCIFVVFDVFRDTE